jgi:carbon-monoxide dehydrogenase large subunit
MLHAKVLRCGVPHARIVRLDTSKARGLRGVRVVLTGEDVPIRHGPIIKDRPVLALDKVRYAGELVAAVAADDEEAAQAAIDAIEVDYEELPGAFDMEAALRPDAPLVHDDASAYDRVEVPGLRVAPAAGSNLCYHFKLRKGDVDAAFSRADVVVEDTFTTPKIQYCHLEPQVAVAQVDPTGQITVWASTMSPHLLRNMIAELAGVPATKVRVITLMVGGGYGSKVYLGALNPLAVLLAMRAPNRAVRLAFDREDEFLTNDVRLPTRTIIKTAAMRDGTLLARKATTFWDKGPYALLGPVIVRNAGYCSLGPYRLPNAWIDGYLVYTNNQSGGGFRGLGVPQVAWAGEQQIDRVARELNIDPLELRLRNALRDGDVSITGETVHAVSVRQCLEQAAQAIDWGKNRDAEGPHRYGKGIACIIKSTLTPSASFSTAKLNSDGSVDILTSAIEHGQGAHTVLSQIVADELSLPLDRVRVIVQDTSVTPFDRSSTSSRTTFHMGNALKEAALDVRHQLAKLAADVLEVHVDDLEFVDGTIRVRGVPQNAYRYADILTRAFGSPATIVGQGACFTKPIYDPMDPDTGQSKRPSVYFMYGAQAAEVRVDVETGHYRVTRLASAVDAGKAINPSNCVQQIEGAAVMGLGFATMEELVSVDGRILNPTFLDYKIPTSLDMPEMVNRIVEVPHPEGPYGAKGIGESSIATTAAAVGNALYAALGIQVHDLPIRAERVFRAIRSAAGRGRS